MLAFLSLHRALQPHRRLPLYAPPPSYQRVTYNSYIIRLRVVTNQSTAIETHVLDPVVPFARLVHATADSNTSVGVGSIGIREVAPVLSLSTSQWIWTGEEAGAAGNAPVGDRAFRKTLAGPGYKTPICATVLITT